MFRLGHNDDLCVSSRQISSVHVYWRSWKKQNPFSQRNRNAISTSTDGNSIGFLGSSKLRRTEEPLHRIVFIWTGMVLRAACHCIICCPQFLFSVIFPFAICFRIASPSSALGELLHNRIRLVTNAFIRFIVWTGALRFSPSMSSSCIWSFVYIIEWNIKYLSWSETTCNCDFHCSKHSAIFLSFTFISP